MDKKVYIVRHAKSSWIDFKLTDFERPLDERGEKDAPVMARFLKTKGTLPDIFIASPAVRAKKTAEVFVENLNNAAPIQFEKQLYHGFPEDYLEQIQSLGEDVHCVMLFGHNPGITYIANMVKADSTDNVPTCGILELIMDKAITWKNADWQKMTLKAMWSPKNI